MGKGRKSASVPAPSEELAPDESPVESPAGSPAGSSVASQVDVAAEPSAGRTADAPAEPRPLLSLEDEADLMVEEASNDEWAYRQAERLVGELPARTGGADR